MRKRVLEFTKGVYDGNDVVVITDTGLFITFRSILNKQDWETAGILMGWLK